MAGMYNADGGFDTTNRVSLYLKKKKKKENNLLSLTLSLGWFCSVLLFLIFKRVLVGR